MRVVRFSFALALAAGTAVVVPPAHSVNTAPRIVSARMVDADSDDRADRVVLTYSEPVRHARDADGSYPFTVGTYGIRQVNGTSTRTLVILLRERSRRDVGAQPDVTYRRTTSSPVRDHAGLQAAGQTFGRTVPLDRDRDGYARTDCEPDKAAVNPGAVDAPDLAFVDSNCDGIDGRRTGPVFVSPSGSDAAPGTIGEPVLTLDHALALAAGRPVYLAKGEYTHGRSDLLPSSLYGGYDPVTWGRSQGGTSVQLGTSIAVTGSRVLQELRLWSSQGHTGLVATDATLTAGRVVLEVGSAPAGHNAVALRATNTRVTWRAGSITAGPGATGSAGTGGAPGGPGAHGAAGNLGSCDSSASVPGAPGGTSVHTAARGGRGGNGAQPGVARGETGFAGGAGAPGGTGGLSGNPGGAGANGANGAAGAPGAGGMPVLGQWSSDGYAPQRAAAGQTGQPGGGGGGGGGGGAQQGTFVIDGTGNSGGGGGAGGTPGGGGQGALGGTASVGVFAVNSTVVLTGTAVTAGPGGDGGLGGPGAGGGAGGFGGAGGAACTGEIGRGGTGGSGGRGGTGGNGGNGAGGPSIGVVTMAGSTLDQSGITWQIGPGGASVNNPAFNGVSAQVHTP